MRKLLCLVVACAVLFAVPLFAADFDATKKAAEGGDVQAQIDLGGMYYSGKGVERDYKQAVEWFRKVAEQGSAEAQNRMGNMYGRGHGVKQDYKQAAEWYRKAAEQGHAWGQCNLGSMYEYGIGTQPNRVKAIEWYKKAAAQDNDKKAKEQAQKNLKRLGAK